MTTPSSSLKERKKESFLIFDDIAGTYDLLNRCLSLGIDVLWRRRMMKELPAGNQLVALDLATGTGDVALELAAQKNVARVRGLDLSKGMIELGKVKIQNKGFSDKAVLDIGDGVTVPVDDASQDVVTLSFGIRNFPDPQTSLKNIYRVLRPNGRALIMEFGLPKNFFVRAFYLFYFRKLLPFVGNLISGHGDAYTYLNKTVEDFPYDQDFLNWMKEAGFKNTRAISLSFGIAFLYIGEK